MKTKEPPQPMPKGSEKILFVEDDADMRELVGNLLKRLGYTVVLAKNGREAYARIAEEKPPFDLIVSDMVMPEMSGMELFHRLQKTNGGLCRMLLLSGYNIEQEVAILKTEGLAGFIKKPFLCENFAEEVRRALDAPLPKTA